MTQNTGYPIRIDRTKSNVRMDRQFACLPV